MLRSTRTALLAAVMILLPALPSAWGAILSGQITDAETGEPVPAASITIDKTSIGTVSDESGQFILEDVPEDAATLIVRHVAYHLWRGTIAAGMSDVDVRLTPEVLPGQDILVTTSRAKRGETPAAFENLTKKEIRRSYHTQDVPMLLTEAPGVYAFSDNGNGIGYSYLSVRGFPQRRVSVLINGVPLNDPESHEVFWIDLPDLPESIQDAQIQRGVGTTLYGSNSIGGTINLRTYDSSPVRELKVTSGFGSYQTRKLSLSGRSGLIDGQYSLYGRFSRIVSDGYRNNAWTDMWSYYFAASRFDEKWTNHLHVFGGPEQTHLAYKGIPRRFIEGDSTFEFNGQRPSGDPDFDRRYNPFEWSNETDNFNQPQYQLLTEFRPDTNWLFENTLFYIKGDGYYDQLRFGEAFSEYHLPSFTRVEAHDGNTDTVAVDEADQLWRRRWVANDFWGIIPRVTHQHGHGVFTGGIEFRHHHGDHWGEVQSAVPADTSFIPGQRFYDYEGRKIVLSGFLQDVFTPDPRVSVTGALQYSFKEYRLYDNKYPNINGQRVTHTTRYDILSPRLGVTVRPLKHWSVFGSVSYNEQEPANDEVYDPQAYFADARDFFNTYNEETGEGSDPIMTPERLIDYEFGVSINKPRWRGSFNLFHMRFHDEIVYNGLLNDDGVPLRANAPTTVHQGVEVAGDVDIGHGFSMRGNLSINDNTFEEFTEFVPDWDNWGDVLPIDTVNRAGNYIAGSPKHLANLRFTYESPWFSMTGHAFRAGRLYLDNSNSPAASIDPYTVFNLRGDVHLGRFLQGADISLFIHLNNVFDEEYETGGYIDDGYPLFLPAAKRNYFAGLEANL